jgi:hypothetical protein
MRLSQLQDAAASFQRALSLQPTHPDARDNLEQARQFMAEQGIFDSSSEDDPVVAFDVDPGTGEVVQNGLAGVDTSTIRHRVKKLPRVHVNDLSNIEHREFARGLRPFVLLGVVNTTKIAQLLQPTTFTDVHGPWARIITDFYPVNMDDKAVKPYLVPLAEAAAELIQPTNHFQLNAYHPGRYFMWNMGYSDWHDFLDTVGPIRLPGFMETTSAWLDAALPTDALKTEFQITSHWRMMLVGSRGAGMFNHIDTLRTASYQLQVRALLAAFAKAFCVQSILPMSAVARLQNMASLRARPE